MNKINKEIAVLFPFKNLINRRLIQGRRVYGGEANIRQVKGMLPDLEVKESSLVGLFSNPKIRYGKFGLNPKTESRIQKAVKEKKPLEFHIAGFPHKMPNPFYTTNKLPDLGELAFLWRLERLCECIEKVYTPGARIRVCVEGTVFHYLAQVSRFEAQTYQEKVGEMAKVFGLTHVEFVDLADLHPLVTGWDKLVRQKAKEIKVKYAAGDLRVGGQIERTWPVMFVTLNARGWPDEEIGELFQKAGKLGRKLTGKWQEMADFALNSTFDYLAYNEIKRETRLMEKAFPQGIKLTVTPKPGALGIWWIKKGIQKLPYYGVPVVRKGKLDNIEYLHDIESYKLKYFSLKGFADKFYYIIISK